MGGQVAQEAKIRIGQRWMTLRKNANLTRPRLRTILINKYDFQISASQIEKIERGQSMPTYETAIVWADFFETDLNFLYCFDRVTVAGSHSVPNLLDHPRFLKFCVFMERRGVPEDFWMDQVAKALDCLMRIPQVWNQKKKTNTQPEFGPYSPND